jgi:hypothetical protein
MISLRIDASELRKMSRDLARLQAQLPQAIARGINEGGDKTRTQVQRALQKQSSLVRYNSVTSRVRTMRAYGSGEPRTGIGPVGQGNLSYAIIVSGKATKPSEFKVKVTRGPGGGVSMLIWGSWHKFRRSFQIAGATGFAGLRARLGPAREKLRSFDGPNLAKEATKGEVATVFFESVAAFVPAAVAKQIARILR